MGSDEQARLQGFDYANMAGARLVVASDGDRYQIYDCEAPGRKYEDKLRGSFTLTAFQREDVAVLDMLRPESR